MTAHKGISRTTSVRRRDRESGHHASGADGAFARRDRKRSTVRPNLAPTSGTSRRNTRVSVQTGDPVHLPADYRPSPAERYMNPRQLQYFRQKLIAWRGRLVEETRRAVENLRHQSHDVGDDAERASLEVQHAVETHDRDRCRKLILKIEDALRRIQSGLYGYCEDTGEEIGLARLEARPIAALSLDAQERREFLRRQQIQ